MQSRNRLFDDLARVASGAAGALAGVRIEMEDAFRQKLERYLAEVDMVPRAAPYRLRPNSAPISGGKRLPFQYAHRLAHRQRQKRHGPDRRIGGYATASQISQRPSSTPDTSHI